MPTKKGTSARRGGETEAEDPEPPSRIPRDEADDRSLDALGRRLKALRKARGMTLDAAAAETGMSRAALSKIERGAMSPTYETLLKIADGFAMDVGPLLHGGLQERGAAEVTRADAGGWRRAAHYDHRLIAPGLGRRAFGALETEVTATSIDDYAEWSRHESEDLFYVLVGRVALHLEGRAPIELNVGDAVQFDGRIAHAVVALPDEGAPGGRPRARILWISAPGG